MGHNLPLMKPVFAVVLTELLKGIGQKCQHSTVQISSYSHNMRNCLAPISTLEKLENLNPPMSCQSHLWKQKLDVASWPEGWNCARAWHFLWVIASQLASVPMEICKRSSHHEIPPPQFLPLEPLYCWSLMETVQTIKKLLQLNHVKIIWKN